jgi:hypothetical protein
VGHDHRHGDRATRKERSVSLTRPTFAWTSPTTLRAIVILAAVAVLATLATILFGAGTSVPPFDLSLDTIPLPF